MLGDLKEGEVKTRFCPSPTGLMHLGNVRTALFNALLAKNTEGTFLLRIEDTDRERSDARYDAILQQDLLWLGLEWQEGPGHNNDHGPYHQSKRQAIYDDYYQRLETIGAVYPCFCSEEELALSRKVQRAAGKPPRYAGTCRHLTEAQCQEKRDAGIMPTLRFRVPADKQIEFDDLVREHQSFDSNTIGDFIVRRANGTPPFLFCNALDDALMGVTHALRGEDHIANTPRQLMLSSVLSLTAPTYGHIALILGDDNSPLSKRNGSRSIEELRKSGYLPNAIINYIARLGHYYGHDDLLSLAELAKQFRIASLSKSPAKFNADQLNYWQKEAVMHLDVLGFWMWMGEAAQESVPEKYRDAFVETVKPNVCFPSEAMRWVDILFSEGLDLSEEHNEILKNAAPNYFSCAADYIKKQGVNYKGLIQHLKEDLKIKGKALFMPLRVALTGETAGPELEKIMSLISQEEIQRRLGRC